MFTVPTNHDAADMLALREDILASPVSVALERARTYTRVFRENTGAPWIVTKATAFREHLRAIPLYVRPHDRIAGSISERPGAMPVNVEIGIGENSIYVGENPHRRGYLRGQVPREIVDYWQDRNLWGRARAYRRTVHGETLERTEVTGYKFLSCQGHLSPSYGELLAVGLGGILDRVRRRGEGETDPAGLEFLTAAELCLLGVSEWIGRYADFLADRATQCGAPKRADDLREMARIAAKVSREPPETFREAMQIIWFCQQAIHIEGHGYSCTPDRIDQLLHPYYAADKAAGRLDDDEALGLCENLILKMRDNTVWGVEHNLTQGVCLAGSTPDGEDRTNELSWLFVAAADRMSVPEPLVWIRWHPAIDQEFFDFCLKTLAGSTCFPLMMSDTAVPAMLMELGVSREDAFNYVPTGCNELAVPGMAYYNPAAGVGYLPALEWAITKGRGYDGKRDEDPAAPAPEGLKTFDDLTAAVGAEIRRQVQRSCKAGLEMLSFQMRWAQTPFT
ncbi:MAG: pyruvate formate lyase family protein, partial [Phycisphaerae bacterium]